MIKSIISILLLFVLYPTLCFADSGIKSGWDYILLPFSLYIAYSVIVIVFCTYKNEHGETVRNWPKIKEMIWNKFTIVYIAITFPLAIIGLILKKLFS